MKANTHDGRCFSNFHFLAVNSVEHTHSSLQHLTPAALLLTDIFSSFCISVAVFHTARRAHTHTHDSAVKPWWHLGSVCLCSETRWLFFTQLKTCHWCLIYHLLLSGCPSTSRATAGHLVSQKPKDRDQQHGNPVLCCPGLPPLYCLLVS